MANKTLAFKFIYPVRDAFFIYESHILQSLLQKLNVLTCIPLRMEKSLIAMEQPTVGQLVLRPTTAVTLGTVSMGLTQSFVIITETGVTQESQYVMVRKMYGV